MSETSAILKDQPGTPEEAAKLGLLDGEFELIVEKLGRTPAFTELAMFSAMWSEHCSYKNSILLLKELYSESDRLLAEAGEENAGALRLNDNQAVVFKIESHNHPSALEPYQGAATGVGGIMRDVFTMGARPLVSLNSLRFGMPDGARNRYLLRQVVKGIGDYGNSLGIPCAGGEIFFHESYTKNPLVNAMTVGIADADRMASSAASGRGNLVMYVGAATGRDGIHGASFASKELSNESASERSAVQVGDPFKEKLLMEATLECIQKQLVVAIQDMGAAGLISSSSEMSSSGDVGMKLFLDKVPAREEAMEPFEYLLSESQERMLMVVDPQKKSEVEAVFEKWELHATVIGEITDTRKLQVYHHNELFADVPVHALTVNSQGAPRYERPVAYPGKTDLKKGETKISVFTTALENNHTDKVLQIIKQVLSHPNIASRHPVYEQYDTDIGTERLIGPGQNAGVYRVPGSKQALAVTTDGNGFYIALQPFEGAQHTVAESFRNVTATGAEAIGITNCLNFANPYKPENYYFFKNAVNGMSEAARFFKTPVTGGNVSFYNESEDGPVLPTPTIGMVGLLENAERALGSALSKGQTVYLLGNFKPSLNASQYGFILEQEHKWPLPELNLADEKASADLLLSLNDKELLKAAIDVSAGGVITALSRMLFSSAAVHGSLPGFEFNEKWQTMLADTLSNNANPDLLLWGETAHCYLVAVEGPNSERIEKVAQEKKVSCIKLGGVNDTALLKINHLELKVSELYDSWYNGLKEYF